MKDLLNWMAEHWVLTLAILYLTYMLIEGVVSNICKAFIARSKKDKPKSDYPPQPANE